MLILGRRLAGNCTINRSLMNPIRRRIDQYIIFEDTNRLLMHGQVRSNHHVSSNHFGGSEEHQQHGDKHGSKPSSATSAAAVAAIKTKDTLKDFLKKYGKIGVLTYGAVSVVSCTFWYLAFKYGLDIGPITK